MQRSTAYTYDANGVGTSNGLVPGTDNEVASDGTWNYAYNADEELVSKTLIAGGTTWAYAYNPLLQDCPIVLMERFDAARAVDLIEKYRVSFTVMVPTMLMRVARLEGVRSRDFSSLERIVYGGASIAEWVPRAWFELIPPERFCFSYGGSEGHGLVMCTGDQWLQHVGTVGLPLNAEVKIFVTAAPEVRARRRTIELNASGTKVEEASVLADIRRRDERDSVRAVAPLKAAPDARLLDTTHLDIDGAFRAAIDIVDAVRAGRKRG